MTTNLYSKATGPHVAGLSQPKPGRRQAAVHHPLCRVCLWASQYDSLLNISEIHTQNNILASISSKTEKIISVTF